MDWRLARVARIHVAVFSYLRGVQKPGNGMEETIRIVLAELDRAVSKHPVWPTDPLHALAVLGEEYGELTQAVLQCTYEKERSSLKNVEKEAIQVAAMSIRFLLSLREYSYEAGSQHKQTP